MAVTGTQLYNKDKKNIYPKSDATVISSDALGAASTVYQDIVTLYGLIQKLAGDDEAVSAIKFQIHYKLGKTTYESDIRGQEGWNSSYIAPTLDFPYTWKRTIIQTVSESVVNYEIVATGELTQTIYRNTSPGEAAIITYDKDQYGNEILNQYDQILPDGWSYTQKSISESAPNAYLSTRERQEDGSWGRFGTPIQYGRWAFDSTIVMRFQVTESKDAPSVNAENKEPGEAWKLDNNEEFTGYLWMINATEVAGVLQAYNNIIWRGPILLSIVK